MKQDKGKEKDIHEAAALKYNAYEDTVPYIVALGKGHVADRMVEAAYEHDVQVLKDSKLSHILNECSVGDEIPETLYRVVAEILVFISNLDDEYKNQFGL